MDDSSFHLTHVPLGIMAHPPPSFLDGPQHIGFSIGGMKRPQVDMIKGGPGVDHLRCRDLRAIRGIFCQRLSPVT